jgi:hypothetical protein
MKSLPREFLLPIAVLLLFAGVVVWQLLRRPVDFSAEVKPILNRHCISCHGGVKQSGGFSLLFQEEALAPTASGQPAILPGRPAHSEMIRRLLSDDPEERMPHKKPPLSRSEIRLLRRWVRQGAVWGEHWAYRSVQPVEVPGKVRLAGTGPAGTSLAGNDIDLFIRQKLRGSGLRPSPEAEKATLLRRLSLDLTGLPPSHSLSEWFLNSEDAGAYEVLVDSLLASPHYGERWAALWLDLARYADTKGYERDDHREIWQYRDWLIRAFNSDMPYDRFITWQLAGDLLEDPWDDPLIATAFHRNTMTNDEGGTDNEEFRVAAVIDRVNTTWDVLMGTTFSCVQCHSHPYDPFRMEDYYRFMAFFNNTRDEDTYDDYPVLRHLQPGDSIRLAALRDWLISIGAPEKAGEVYRFIRTWQPSVNSLTADQFENSELADTKWLVFRNFGTARLQRVALRGNSRLLFRYMTWLPGNTLTIRLDHPDGEVLKTIDLPHTGGKWNIGYFDYPATEGVRDLYFAYRNRNLTSPAQNGLMFDWFHATGELPGKGLEGYDRANEAYWALLSAPAGTTPIMMENPGWRKRPDHVFERGNWLTPAEPVEPGVPAALSPWPEGAPPNRLGLARWMTDPEHPLTSRTLVNRIWEQLFGTGLAETLEDLGSQGIPPSHPELLDHLSWKLMQELDWSIKKLLKYILLSHTYRQSSDLRPEHAEIDPQNRLYARAPRFRLSAEQVRDQALAVSGLLSKKMYGPSVKPYQPEGIWLSPYNSARWEKSSGEDQYRRALYTYWKRTSPYPSMIGFDAMAREVCSVRRIRTNTPLQALVTLNDPVYVEASAHLAQRMRDHSPELLSRLRHGYKSTMCRDIDPERLEILEKLYLEAYEQYRQKDATEAERVATELVAAALLNLDEFLTKN